MSALRATKYTTRNIGIHGGAEVYHGEGVKLVQRRYTRGRSRVPRRPWLVRTDVRDLPEHMASGRHAPPPHYAYKTIRT